MAYAQTQKIGGVTTGFGSKVSINGYYSITADGNGNCYFYQRSVDGVWSLEETIVLSGASIPDIGNEYFVIGDPSHNSSAGRARVYAISNPATVIQAFAGVSASDTFGAAVAISDDYILIGAQGADSNKGDAYLYIKDAGATWTAYSGNPITPALRTSNDFFGCSVAISGDSLIIGAEGDNNKTGAVYIFEKNDETELWEESQKLLASDGNDNDRFGESVSASGVYFVAGASRADSADGDIDAGVAYIYKNDATWFEVDKLVSVDETTPSGDHFGESVDINGDYIVIGSPEARSTGVADVFYKKRSWGHLKKIIGSDSLLNDTFGAAVAISGRFALIGAPTESTNGAIYYLEDPQVRLRLAQEFEVNTEYLPTKASVYLKRVGKNTNDYWPIYNTAKTVIDATNFSTIDTGTNIVTFEDSLSRFTGNGYMYLNSDKSSTFSTVNYPVRAIVPDTFNLWIRCLTTISTTFQIDVLVDGVKTKTIDGFTSEPSAMAWEWVNTTIVIPDTREHILGIKIKENGVAIDKIYTDASSTTPYSEGPDYGESPYLTIHMQVYDSENDSPGSSLFIYDYKNSIDQVVQSDWYNFNINVLDNNHGYTSSSNFTGNYFLVISSSGTTHDNFIVWEMADNDEYMTLPSVFRF